MTKEAINSNADDLSRETVFSMWRHIPPTPTYMPSKIERQDNGNADSDVLYGGHGG